MTKEKGTPIAEKFLGSVAAHILKKGMDMSRLWIVFPNKRAPILFRRYIKRLSKGIFIMPHLTTIGAFNERFGGDVILADRTELLFILYRAYSKVLAEKGFTPKAFDSFAWWGNIMLEDFDQIDASMADARDLYTNIDRYNEIKTNFLSEEQIELLKGIWGEDAVAQLEPSEVEKTPFWTHMPDANGNKPSERFMHLWHMSYDIYRQFNADLDAQRLTYPGKLHRMVNQNLHDTCAEDLPFEHICFVGFSNVSLATGKTMKMLMDRNKASFYWDVLPDMPYNTMARRLVSRLAAKFKMPRDYQLPRLERTPQIEVLAVPSSFMQTKVAGEIISTWNSNGLIDPTRSDNTCVMLPDTSLLSAITHALPSQNSKDSLSVNVTMGLSYKDTPFASLLSSIVSMHMRRRNPTGVLTFFHDDIKSLVSNPLLIGLMPTECYDITYKLNQEHQYNIPASTLCETAPKLAPFFADIEDLSDWRNVRTYLNSVMYLLEDVIAQTAAKNHHRDASITNEGKILSAYRQGAERIFSCLERYRITEIGEGRVLGLIEKLLGTFTLNMSGTPLAGLQVMGMLETRALDFDNLIVLSANERIMPKQSYSRSLIPQAVRRAFGLPMAEDLDTEYAYYFFRLLTRARRVICTYDSRTAGLSTGAMSRYLLQLKLLAPKGTITFKNGKMLASAPEKRELTVYKTPEVYKQLQGLKDPYKGYNLSASALKKYMSCPLKFYLDCVRGLREDDEPKPYMTASVFGTIIHDTLQDIFVSLRPNPQDSTPVQVTEAALMTAIEKNALRERILRKVDLLHHKGRFASRLDAMPAESRLIAEMMVDFVEKVILKDVEDIRDGKSFKFWGAEMKTATVNKVFGDNMQWKASEKNCVNVRMDIDRVDILDDGILRFIDYKTGRDTNIAKNMDDIFSGENDAIFQLLFYATVFTELNPQYANTIIIPSIYRIAKAFDSSKTGKEAFSTEAIFIGSYRDMEQIIWNNPDSQIFDQKDFRRRLADMIDSIFDVEIPFSQTENEDHCLYCAYKNMCHRKDENSADN